MALETWWEELVYLDLPRSCIGTWAGLSIYLVAVIFLLFEIGAVSAFGVTDSISLILEWVARLERQFRIILEDWVLLSGDKSVLFFLYSSSTYTVIPERFGKFFSWW